MFKKIFYFNNIYLNVFSLVGTFLVGGILDRAEKLYNTGI
ncbi:hypothetical protein LEP1GSC008_1306 [Leptospira kirschneri serovar Bulgarica str. Nikolaevo]|uniref:Uncharacterized protein n=1 Tax=Leptospira kirschneri serovar Bulgarica str. Nikolaevo TaxID=1240687 RepID=M6FCN6_9LEPT|nr:hypothetical protein LEP1GSC008_1306 [Leptospira kirschneri serovar Bulgarica str. Nikolaevo]